MDALTAYFSRATFVFTTDIEWSPDWAIRELFELADSYGIPLTPFITHPSDFLVARLATDHQAREDAGVHPNFLSGSSHGATADGVIAHVRALVPEAICFRAHCFYEDTRTLRKLTQQGFRYDSNVLAFLQPMLAPFVTAAGTIRFPVWWEDDVHSEFGLPWELSAILSSLETPGLKLVNVHPLRVALNVPSEAVYESKRSLYEGAASATTRSAHAGPGTRTLLEELMRYATSDGRRPQRLRDLYDEAARRRTGAPTRSG